ncbi:hypothetical protein HFO98_10840 [Rhizobium leguminosarum]|uniref:hypothetical protein n=1 Tax=Rhizobium leguminosarum TaxID=384 RepID=UPI001C9668A2|nr:hypothetical protein [Rhizobium leguminosarum]MBY5408958.1 hypothetical protein [Rhizobium leguminosarum]
MAAYSIDEAIRELAPALGKAPAGAVSGEWTASTMQAGHSSRTGGYLDAEGKHVPEGSGHPLDIIAEVVEKLAASGVPRFNKVVIRWKKPKFPFMQAKITLETSYDQAMVPRGPDDPIYETAAAARRAFWQSRGTLQEDFAVERGTANIHAQTKWFGPHRRILAIHALGRLTLATDGLSTPWAGISEPENGVECELFMEFDAARLDTAGIENWANLLINIGDLVADGHRVARDVEKHGAILFCRLTEDYLPMSRIVLSRDAGRIDGLPFGSVPLIRATPIAEAEIEAQDLSDDWGATAARHALAKRGIR